MLFTYLPYVPGRTNTAWCQRYHAPERDQFKARRAGKIAVKRALITGLRPGTVKSKSDNIAKAPNVPTLVFPQRPPEDGGGRAIYHMARRTTVLPRTKL